MARKISDFTNRSTSPYGILSETPKNNDKRNFWIKELQDKVNADWEYRPNRFDVEYESEWGQSIWKPEEVVIQTVKNDAGTAIADDYRRLVFRNILDDRFKIGSKFRFSPTYDYNASDDKKDVWLVTNFDKVTATSAVVVQRCNGVLGSVYKDTQGIAHYHYEPVIQTSTLNATDFSYTPSSVTMGGNFVITVQYNEFTSLYKVNQRFIIGARVKDPGNPGHFIGGQVYRILAINNFYSSTTYDSEDVGLIKLYMQITESDTHDDWDNRIAYQNDTETVITQEKHQYHIAFKEPTVFPEKLGNTVITFAPALFREDGQEVGGITIETSLVLNNWKKSSTASMSDYVLLTQLEQNNFSLQKIKDYPRGNARLECLISADNSPSGEQIQISFDLALNDW